VGFVRISSIRRHLDAISRHDRRNGRLGDDGCSTPESRIPRRADGILVTEEWRREFPQIPGVATPRAPSALPLLDFGPQAEIGILKAPDIGPGGGYTIFVPAVDEDGNDRAGVRAPMVASPTAPIAAGTFGPAASITARRANFSGNYIPFSGERRTTGDARRSILECYAAA
jgi:hypothetical protein